MEHVQVPFDILYLFDGCPPYGLFVAGDENSETVLGIDYRACIELRTIDNVFDLGRLPFVARRFVNDGAHAWEQCLQRYFRKCARKSLDQFVPFSRSIGGAFAKHPKKEIPI